MRFASSTTCEGDDHASLVFGRRRRTWLWNDHRGNELAGEVGAKMGFDVYALPGCDTNTWLGLSGALDNSVVAGWMNKQLQGGVFVGAADSFMTLRELAAAGIGQAVLPCVLGDSDSRLERRRGRLPDLAIDIWVASHVDLVDVPRIRAVRQVLVEALAQDADRLSGVSA